MSKERINEFNRQILEIENMNQLIVKIESGDLVSNRNTISSINMDILYRTLLADN